MSISSLRWVPYAFVLLVVPVGMAFHGAFWCWVWIYVSGLYIVFCFVPRRGFFYLAGRYYYNGVCGPRVINFFGLHRFQYTPVMTELGGRTNKGVCTVVRANKGRCHIRGNSMVCVRGLGTRISRRVAFSGIITMDGEALGINGPCIGSTFIGNAILGGNGNGGVAIFACGPGGNYTHGVNRERPCAGMRVARVNWLM